MWSVAALAAVFSLTTEGRAEEILDLTGEYIYEQTVTPHGPSGGCGEAPRMAEMACAADPYAAYCASIPAAFRKAREEETERKKAEIARMKELTKAALPGCKKTGIAKFPEADVQPAIQSIRERFIEQCVSEIVGRADVEAVSKVTGDALAVFTKMLSGSRDGRVLRQGKRLAAALKGCLAKPRLDVSFLVLDASMPLSINSFAPHARNAGVNRSFGAEKAFDDGALRAREGETANPIGEMFRMCKLGISPAQWLDCKAGRPSCYQILFHEFAHLINSCTFHRLADEAQKGSEWNEDRPFSDYYDFRDKLFSEAAKTNRGLARSMEDATSCLSELSAPRFAIANACSAEQPLREKPRGPRCNEDVVTGYPTQWYEAEADFWGASALAVWLQRKPGQDARREDFKSIVYDQCLESGSPAAVKPPEAPPVAVNPKAECRNRPLDRKAKTLPAPWNDEHQTQPVRFNRHYLRNLDLRRALGCGVNEVGMACSPLGVRAVPIVSALKAR